MEPNKRPQGWKPNAEILKKVEDALKDPAMKEKIEKSKARGLALRKTSSPSATELPSEQVPRGGFDD